jgi:hypothetical protein
MSVKRRLVLSLALGSLLALALASVATATHPRPGGGSPLRVPFVPMFKQCLAPNSAHIAPLAFPSCTPPVLNSQMLTTGTTGAGQGSSKLQVFCTDPPQTPPCTPNDGFDTEDIKVDATSTDVECSITLAPHCSNPGGDYTGIVLGQSTIRITDHANGIPPTVCTNGGGTSPCVTATMQDIVFSVPVQCVANGSATAPPGANCNISSTIDTLVPTATKEFQRAVVSVFGINVLDEGPDGSISPGGSATCPPICGSGDETTYANQGLFIP